MKPNASIPDLLHAALSHHQSGATDAAERLYQQILERDSQHVEALRLLGILLRERGDLEAARKSLEQALALQPLSAQLHHDFGLLCYDAGNLPEARDSLRRSIQLDSKAPDAHFNLGNIQMAMHQFPEAEDCYLKAIQGQVAFPDAHFNLGRIALRRQNSSAAVMRFFLAWMFSPANDELARAVEDARAAYLNALATKFDGAFEDSEERQLQHPFRKENSASGPDNIETPDTFEASSKRAVKAEQDRDFTAAVRWLIKAVFIKPEDGHTYYNLGCVLHRIGLYETAAAAFSLGILRNASPTESFHNLGFNFVGMRLYAEAIACYRAALAIDRSCAKAEYALATVRLLLGDLAQGWIHYEARFKPASYTALEQAKPAGRWEGQDLRGKTLLVLTEQGFGDAIQFVRFLPLVAERGGKVILGCHPQLKSLLQTAKGVHELVTPGDTMSAFDFYALLMSLPRVLGINLWNIPKEVPYLTAPVNRTLSLPVVDRSLLKVGVVWAGSSKKGDARRSIPFLQLDRLLKTEGCCFYSLQVEDAGPEFSLAPSQSNLIDLRPHLKDWGCTASLIMELDLVITVDTGVAHLAGALAKPVWVLLQFDSEWRWMLDREDSPWYPTMRLFRQPQADDWKSVLDRVVTELGKLTRS